VARATKRVDVISLSDCTRAAEGRQGGRQAGQPAMRRCFSSTDASRGANAKGVDREERWQHRGGSWQEEVSTRDVFGDIKVLDRRKSLDGGFQTELSVTDVLRELVSSKASVCLEI